MRLSHYTLCEVRRRWVRTLLTTLGIALGVAVFVAALAANRSARRAYRDLFEQVSGPHSLEIVSPDSTGFDPALTARLTGLPGVEAVLPRIVTSTALRTPSGGVPVLVLGLADSDALQHSGLCEASGESFSSRRGLWLDTRQAAALRLQAGQGLGLWTPQGLVRLPVRGQIQTHGPLALNGPPVACVPLAVAQEAFRLPGQVNSVQVLLAESCDARTVQPLLEQQLPAGLVVQSPGARTETAEATLQTAEEGLNALACVALVTAAFVVLNTFLLNLGERRQRLALLHALGATRAEVLRLLLVEAGILGLVGGALGLVAGWALERGLSVVMGQCWGVVTPPSTLSWPVQLAAVLAGPGLAVAAALLAFRQSGRLSPLEALRPLTARTARGTTGKQIIPGLVLAILAAALIGLAAPTWLPARSARLVIGPGAAVFLAGWVLALPLLTQTVLAGGRRWLGGLLRAEGEMALHQLARRLPRTNLTVGVFFVAIAAAIAFGHSLVNILHDLQHWYERTLVADYFVRTAMPDSGFLLTAPLPERLAGPLARIEGIERVDSMRFLPARVNDTAALVLARTVALDRPPPMDLRSGDRSTLAARLRAGEAAVAEALARRLAVGVGDHLTLQTASGPRRIRIAATVNEYAVGGLALYLEWEAARRLLPFSGAHAFLVGARPEALAGVHERLQDFCAREELQLQSNAELHGTIDALVSRVGAALWALIALGFLIASLGITNTLSMNLLEQAPELGILRALGMKRAQLARSVLYQGTLLVLLSAVPAAAAGLALANLLNRACGQVFGQQAAFHIHPLQIAGCLGMALLVGLLASVLPARRSLGLALPRKD
jgi:putative ABC transport system permease protein